MRSPNFDVVSDGSAKQARHIAGQLERLRAAFHAMFPSLALNGTPVEVLALKTEDEFQALVPRQDVGRGRVKFASYYQDDPDRGFILLNLEANQDNDDFPYENVFDSYAMSLTAAVARTPLWLRQGLGEFYGTARIENTAVTLGLIDPYRLSTLRGSFHLMPVATLLAVTEKSPYYQREGKAEPFFSECWLLTHFLILQDQRTHGDRLQAYLKLIAAGTDPVAAGRQAFGDLSKLDEELAQYLRHQAFPIARFAVTTTSEEANLPAAQVAPLVQDAMRASLQIHIGEGETEAGVKLATAVIAADPGSRMAHEALAFAADRAGNLASAVDQYQQTLGLGSTNAFVETRYAELELRQGGGALDAATAAKVEAALQAVIGTNPGVADNYAQLAFLYASRGEKPDQADHLELIAIALAPRVALYRLNRANLLLRAHRVDDAIAVLKQAQPLDMTPEQQQQCAALLANAEQYQAEMLAARARAPAPASARAPEAPPTPPGPPTLVRREAEATTEPKLDGAHQVFTGTIQAVRCGFHQSGGQTTFTLDLDLAPASPGGKQVTLHSADFLKVPFRATNFTPHGVLNPCADLQGLHARITAAGNQLLRLDVSR